MAENPERKWTTLKAAAPVAAGAFVEGPGAFDPSDEAVGGAVESAAESLATVLIAHPAASTARLIRETLESFTDARVFTTADPLRAFERPQRRYTIFFLAMQLGELSGPMLYELISKAYASERGPHLLAPGVVFVREKDDPKLPDALARDVRVKDVLNKPIRIERLLECVRGVLEVKDPTVRG
jgi:CheY-like chemotaxis protein